MQAFAIRYMLWDSLLQIFVMTIRYLHYDFIYNDFILITKLIGFLIRIVYCPVKYLPCSKWATLWIQSPLLFWARDRLVLSMQLLTKNAYMVHIILYYNNLLSLYYHYLLFRFRYSFICQSTSIRRQQSDLFGLRVKLLLPV